MRSIDVRLHSISCEYNGFGGNIPIEGSISGSTYFRDSNNPADLRDTRVIYPFPNGPVKVSEGETVSIRMDRSVSFTLRTPVHDPEAYPDFLKVTVALNHELGTQSWTFRNNDTFPLRREDPLLKTMHFSTPNIRVNLVFAFQMWVEGAV
ncbi:hypothetical protein [Mycobacterium sp. 48b]|uniref:hypothetical protein n=1 Tax=Mycobacterium sp. 48b TaxID=3400426 RepID=UPI003AADBEF0